MLEAYKGPESISNIEFAKKQIFSQKNFIALSSILASTAATRIAHIYCGSCLVSGIGVGLAFKVVGSSMQKFSKGKKTKEAGKVVSEIGTGIIAFITYVEIEALTGTALRNLQLYTTLQQATLSYPTFLPYINHHYTKWLSSAMYKTVCYTSAMMAYFVADDAVSGLFNKLFALAEVADFASLKTQSDALIKILENKVENDLIEGISKHIIALGNLYTAQTELMKPLSESRKLTKAEENKIEQSRKDILDKIKEFEIFLKENKDSIPREQVEAIDKMLTNLESLKAGQKKTTLLDQCKELLKTYKKFTLMEFARGSIVEVASKFIIKGATIPARFGQTVLACIVVETWFADEISMDVLCKNIAESVFQRAQFYSALTSSTKLASHFKVGEELSVMLESVGYTSIKMAMIGLSFSESLEEKLHVLFSKNAAKIVKRMDPIPDLDLKGL